MIKMARTNVLQLNEDEKEFLDDLIVETSQAFLYSYQLQQLRIPVAVV